MNTFGQLFRLTTFGESHGEAIGGVIDGMPAGIPIDVDFIQQELARRRPGQSHITTSRQEQDQVELLSGVFEGKSTGCPIGFMVRNTNQHSNDYDNMRDLYRPSHADYTYSFKYGTRDHRGGGRSSARITISRCVAGALAKLALRQLGIRIFAYTSQVGDIALEDNYTQYDLHQIESNIVRCPCHSGLSSGIGFTRVRQAACSVRRCYAQHQCRQGLRIWRGICWCHSAWFRAKRHLHHGS